MIGQGKNYLSAMNGKTQKAKALALSLDQVNQDNSNDTAKTI